ncbi:transcriptional regulator, IclR family [Aeromicrobium choanae]|uniref:Transcriptional regulator, IclR family n=2 Tax=Aeromicrobium choanae TaxID=1736691 RepID=A0A1T4YWE4_9ACTN|nr:transcriptional regulator, IclR family [Aeromicrobium choanae]
MVRRFASLLRALSVAQESGSSTTEAAARAGMPRPTAHRVLTAMLDEGFVDRDHRTGRWFLGPEAYVLGMAAAARYDVTPAARRIVAELARRTGESAFFSVRRGDETVCLLREDGSFPLRSHVLHEGIRFPLGVASAGLAILSMCRPDEIDAYLARTDLTDDWGPDHTAEAIRDRVAVTQRDGYAVNPGLIVEGSWGLGAAVFDASGSPQWAVSLTGVESRFGEDRRTELGAALLEASHAITRSMGRTVGGFPR